MTPRTAQRPTAPVAFPERKLCASPACCNSYVGAGDGSGLCERCALERDLFDRDIRLERAFPVPQV